MNERRFILSSVIWKKLLSETPLAFVDEVGIRSCPQATVRSITGCRCSAAGSSITIGKTTPCLTFLETGGPTQIPNMQQALDGFEVGPAVATQQ